MAMNGYTKLFNSIVASTIWSEPDETRIVWITMLALANSGGIVEASVPGLAVLARVTPEKCRAAIATLEAPDPDSRSQEYEGRRIRKVDGGWLILNHTKYRSKLNAEERREYKTIKQREYRTKSVDSSVDNSVHKSTVWTHTDTDTDTKADTGKVKISSAPQNGAGLKTSDQFQIFWDAYPRKEAKKNALKIWIKYGLDFHLGEILGGLEAWKRARDPEYMPYAESWLNLESWKEIPLKGKERLSKHEQTRQRREEAFARARGNLANNA